MHLNSFEHIHTYCNSHRILLLFCHLNGRNKRWHVVPIPNKVFHLCIIPRRCSILSSYPLLYYPGRAVSTPMPSFKAGISRPLRPWLIIPHTLVLQGSQGSNVSHVMIIEMPTSCRQMPSSCRGLSASLHAVMKMKDLRLLFPRGTKSLHLLLRQRTGSTRQNGARIFGIRASVDMVLDVSMSIVCLSFVRQVWCLPYLASLLWVLDFGKWISTFLRYHSWMYCMCAYDMLIVMCNTLFGVWTYGIWYSYVRYRYEPLLLLSAHISFLLVVVRTM